MSFLNPIDIANRATDHLGQDPIVAMTDQNKRARILSRIYDKLRQYELRRNVWRFAIRKAVLRPIDVNTMLLSPSLWASTTTYFVGSLVSDQTGQIWMSRIPNNLGNQPELSTVWVEYFGPMTVMLFDPTTAYQSGELVYTAAGDGTNRVYMSLQSANSDVPSAATAWDATVTYRQNQVVTFSAVPYMSLVDLNLNQQPSTHPAQWGTVFVGGAGSIKWLQIGGAEFPFGVTLSTMNIQYPLTSGPSSQSSTLNAFRLPSGFLREAPQDPKAGSVSYLGASWGRAYTDWEYEGNYIISRQANSITLRFVADTVDVAAMDPMFCEGLGASMGLEACEGITGSTEKVKLIADFYKLKVGEARTVNGIETGSVEPPIDDYVACRA